MNWIQSLVGQSSTFSFIPSKTKYIIQVKTNFIPLECLKMETLNEFDEAIVQIILNYEKSLNDINNQGFQQAEEVFNNSILQQLFQDPGQQGLGQSLKALREKLGQGKSGICGKILRGGDVGYKCLDCGLDNSCIVCKECFENGSHQNHRYVLKQYCGGCCDCGDPEAWNPKGFCIKHKGFEQLNDEQVKEILGETMFNRVKQIFLILLYCLIQTAELMISKCLDKQQQKDGQISDAQLKKFSYEENEKLSMLFNTIIGEIIQIIDKVPVLMKIFSSVLMTNLSHTPNLKLIHDCQNFQFFKVFYANDNIENQMRPCQCSFLQNIFRLSLIFSAANTKMFSELLIQLFNFYDFKQYLALTYCQMINFFSIINFGNLKDVKKTKLLDLNVQLLTSDELSSYILSNLKDKKILFSKPLQMIQSIEKVEDDSCFLYFFQHIDYITEKPLSLQVRKYFQLKQAFCRES